MYVRRLVWLVVIWMTGVSVGCAPIRPIPPNAPAQPTPTVAGLQLSTTHPITQENTVTLPIPSTNPMVVDAFKDLARRINVQLDQITLVSTEAVVWPDGSMGCPKPGMVYTQVMQDGMRMILGASGKEYHYHSGENRSPFLCENPAP